MNAERIAGCRLERRLVLTVVRVQRPVRAEDAQAEVADSGRSAHRQLGDVAGAGQVLPEPAGP